MIAIPTDGPARARLLEIESSLHLEESCDAPDDTIPDEFQPGPPPYLPHTPSTATVRPACAPRGSLEPAPVSATKREQIRGVSLTADYISTVHTKRYFLPFRYCIYAPLQALNRGSPFDRGKWHYSIVDACSGPSDWLSGRTMERGDLPWTAEV